MMDLLKLNYQSLLNEVATGAIDGAGVDISQLIGPAAVQLHTPGNTGTTAGLLQLRLQHSDDDGDTDPYTNANIAFANVNDANASLQQVRVDTRAVKKFVKVVGQTGGDANTTFPISAVIFGQPQAIE